MKAVQVSAFGAPEVLKLVDLPEPSIAEDEVLIKVEAIGVNFADLLMRENRYHIPPGLPFVPGFEVAGTAVRVGQKVEGFGKGDRVLSSARMGYGIARQ